MDIKVSDKVHKINKLSNKGCGDMLIQKAILAINKPHRYNIPIGNAIKYANIMK